MARDYAKTRSSGGKRKPRSKPAAKRRRTRKSARVPGWVWLFCGLCIGLTAAAGVYVFGRPAGAGGVQVAGIEIPAPGARAVEDDAASGEKSADEVKPRFAFYEMLPNYEVVIPEEEYQHEDSRSQRTTPKVEQPGRYVIQAGSFSSHDDADRRKAGLAILGVESEIAKVSLSAGRTVYRVRTKPLDNLGKLNSTLKRLRENGIDTLVMRDSK